MLLVGKTGMPTIRKEDTCVCMYVCMYICMCVCVSMYIYVVLVAVDAVGGGDGDAYH